METNFKNTGVVDPVLQIGLYESQNMFNHMGKGIYIFVFLLNVPMDAVIFSFQCKLQTDVKLNDDITTDVGSQQRQALMYP